MTDKYDASEHIAILSELTTLYDVVNETQTKIVVARKKLDKMNELKKDKR